MTGADGDFEALADAVRAKFQQAAILELSQSLDATPDHHWPPTPGTAHPSLERNAAFVRHLMTEGRYSIYLPVPSVPRFVDFDSDEPQMLERTTLNVKHAAGPAPYVGAPFVYEWRIAVDKAGRYVAGEAERTLLPCLT